MGGGVKITSAWDSCCFVNLHLPKNSQFLIGAVISSSCQSQAKCVIWTLNCSRGKMWKMANSVNGEVVSFDSTCKEALKKHFQILICLILSNQNQKPQFLHWFLERILTGHVANCLWEKLDIIFLILTCWFAWKKFWQRNLQV